MKSYYIRFRAYNSSICFLMLIVAYKCVKQSKYIKRTETKQKPTRGGRDQVLVCIGC